MDHTFSNIISRDILKYQTRFLKQYTKFETEVNKEQIAVQESEGQASKFEPGPHIPDTTALSAYPRPSFTSRRLLPVLLNSYSPPQPR
jgi:hypothetical protein